MNLKNYTSTTPAEKSIAAIKKTLVRMGAKNINEEYKDQVLIKVKFLIDVNGNTIAFDLPANVEACYQAFLKTLNRNKNGDFHGSVDLNKWMQQAERTAWKLIADWVEVQASMIYLEQAEVVQVFMPYAITKNGSTIYEVFKSGGMKMLSSGQ